VNWIIDQSNALRITLGGQQIDLPFGQSISIPTITLDTPNIPRLEYGGEVLKTGLAVVHEGERFSGTRGQYPIERMPPPRGVLQPIVMQVHLDGREIARSEAFWDQAEQRLIRESRLSAGAQ
jgi:hypothetical protein